MEMVQRRLESRRALLAVSVAGMVHFPLLKIDFFFFSFTRLATTQLLSAGLAGARTNHGIPGPREQAQQHSPAASDEKYALLGTTPLTFGLVPQGEDELCPISGFFSLLTAVKYLQQLQQGHLY